MHRRARAWGSQHVLSCAGGGGLFSQLHTGMSLEVFKMWAHVDRNMIILPGYCVPGTVGNKVFSRPQPRTCWEDFCGTGLGFASAGFG